MRYRASITYLCHKYLITTFSQYYIYNVGPYLRYQNFLSSLVSSPTAARSHHRPAPPTHRRRCAFVRSLWGQEWRSTNTGNQEGKETAAPLTSSSDIKSVTLGVTEPVLITISGPLSLKQTAGSHHRPTPPTHRWGRAFMHFLWGQEWRSTGQQQQKH